MKVLFGGKFSGDFSPEKGLIYKDQEVLINRGISAPRRVATTDLIISSKIGTTHAILGRFIMKPR